LPGVDLAMLTPRPEWLDEHWADLQLGGHRDSVGA
jgi:hypothetical protein